MTTTALATTILTFTAIVAVGAALRATGVSRQYGAVGVEVAGTVANPRAIVTAARPGLGLGIALLVMMSVFLLCHRNRKRRRSEHPMLPSHAHFHTCESIGERFATSSSMDSVSSYPQTTDVYC